MGNLTGAIAKKFVCKAWSKGCSRGITQTCDQTCSDCLASPPCVQTGVRIHCTDCNRHFRSQSWFAKIRWNGGLIRRMFVRVNASVKHAMNSCSRPENMNVAKNIAKHVKQIQRQDISAICSHWSMCCHQATEHSIYSTILKQRKLHDTLRRLNYTSLIWFVYNSFVLAVRDLKMSIRTYTVRKEETFIFGWSSERYVKLSVRRTPLM
jgi:hypothetical protein